MRITTVGGGLRYIQHKGSFNRTQVRLHLYSQAAASHRAFLILSLEANHLRTFNPPSGA